jgi:transcriptional regulator with PAS, ATPase and Fis domain
MKEKELNFLTDFQPGIVYLTADLKVKWFNKEAESLLEINNVAQVEDKLNLYFEDNRVFSGNVFGIENGAGGQQIFCCLVKSGGEYLLLVFDEVFFSKIALFNRESDMDKLDKYYSHHAQGHDSIVASRNPMVQEMLSNCLKVASINATVLITGESGVGKEVMARIIHRAGDRSSGEMLCINCSCIPENLLEAELFGYEEGAFTGARKGGKAGLFLIAKGGTIFLDEVGELPYSMQVKLLRAIQDKQVFPIGSSLPVEIDVRIIAATNRNLKKLVKEGLFREDLYYRLNVIPINIPPLRERREDIVPLANFFLGKYCSKFGLERRVTPEAMSILENYSWPGNIRQLENIIQRSIIFSRSMVIGVKLIEEMLFSEGVEKLYGIESEEHEVQSLSDVVDQAEKEALLRVKKTCKTTRQMAEVLKISQASVVRKVKKHLEP